MADFAEVALVRGLDFLAETQAAIAHNLANVQSTAFKRRAAYAETGSVEFSTLLGAALPTVRYRERTSWVQGDVESTGDAFHAAIEGEGFFAVRGADGRIYYTRNGEMSLDKDGRLTNKSGLPYLGLNGEEIVLRNDEGRRPTSIRISPDGTITDSTSGGQVWGPLGVFQVRSLEALEPVGSGLFLDRSGAQPLPGATGRVRHKHLERSNVDGLREMVQMIAVQRGFQATARALSTLGRLKRTFISAFNG